MIYNFPLGLLFDTGERCRSENTLDATAIETENPKHSSFSNRFFELGSLYRGANSTFGQSGTGIFCAA